MARRYEESFKKYIVKQHQTGTSAIKLCSQYGIARSTLFLWKKQYTVDEVGQMPRERYLLEKELDRLRTENMIFKTAVAYQHLLCLNAYQQLICIERNSASTLYVVCCRSTAPHTIIMPFVLRMKHSYRLKMKH